MKSISFALLLIFFSVISPPPGSAGCPDHSGNAAAVVSYLPEGARASERIFGLPGLPNAGRVAPGIFRGGQPLPEGYATLKKMGIKTVINLRYRHSEKAAVEALGMKSVEVPFNTIKKVDRKEVDRIVDLMADPSLQPVYIHCALGKDRTGIVVAAYRMKKKGWTFREAAAEMQAFGFNDFWINLKDFIRDYAEHK
jgi:tyrosine-protein phosphatase SIW14